MTIVTTSVHHARIRRNVVSFILFGHRQGVHVKAQQHDRPFLLALQGTHHPCLANARPYLQAKVGQSLGHDASRTCLLKAQFWVAVKITPGLDQVFA